MLYNSREPHERHGKNAGGDEGDGGAFHALRRLHQVDVLTDACEDDQGKGETEGDAKNEIYAIRGTGDQHLPPCWRAQTSSCACSGP